MAYSKRIVDAVALAHELHATQMRKGREVPYITHLFGVAALVGEHGGDEDQFIAALLHDGPEDQGGEATLAVIRAQFGERVAQIVEACSDTYETPKPPWRTRKEAHLDHMRSLPADARLVIAADKLHNAQGTLADVLADGLDTLDRFKGGRDGTAWYYAAAAEALGQGWSHPLLDQLAAVAQALHDEVNNARP